VLYGVLRHDARPCAQISLYRGRADRPFSERDAATLRSLLRYLASGLSRKAVAAGGDGTSVAVEEAVGVVALDGTPLSASAQWQRMLRLLVLDAVSPRAARNEEAAIGAYLRAICAGLARDAAAWRERVHDSAAGRHVVRAWRLAPATAGGPEGMALLLRREEPRSVALLRGTAAAGLSPQQCEVALLLAEGLTNQAIAQQLSLSLNTAGYHVKQVHARLGVNDRNAVQARLLALGRSATGS
jgi:DNA-binding CsgD family transcriptional regulator